MMSRPGRLTVEAEEVDVVASAPLGRRVSQAATALSVSALTRDFLAWVAGGPRSYTEAMEAWRSSCPRFTIWEDALGDGLIYLEGGSGVAMHRTMVLLTPRGRAALDGH